VGAGVERAGVWVVWVGGGGSQVAREQCEVSMTFNTFLTKLSYQTVEEDEREHSQVLSP